MFVSALKTASMVGVSLLQELVANAPALLLK